MIDAEVVRGTVIRAAYGWVGVQVTAESTIPAGYAIFLPPLDDKPDGTVVDVIVAPTEKQP